jgi:glutaconyl-CoA decarboxylase
MQTNVVQAEAIMKEIDAEVERIKNFGIPAAKVHERSEMTVWDRIEYVVDPGTFCPLHTIFDP